LFRHLIVGIVLVVLTYKIAAKKNKKKINVYVMWSAIIFQIVGLFPLMGTPGGIILEFVDHIQSTFGGSSRIGNPENDFWPLAIYMTIYYPIVLCLSWYLIDRSQSLRLTSKFIGWICSSTFGCYIIYIYIT